MRYAFIACDHGLGHLRRTLLRASQAASANDQVSVLCSADSLNRLRFCVDIDKRINILELNTKTTVANLSGSINDSVKWLGNLPELSDYDIIISDNLLEVLTIYPKAIIHAQFFWHRVLRDINNEYYELCEYVLASCKPTVYGCPIFSMPHVRSVENFVPLDLPALNPSRNYGSRRLTRSGKILVSGGSTSAYTAFLSSFVEDIMVYKPDLARSLVVDKQIYEQLIEHISAKELIIADYSQNMYSQIEIAFCRPGLGTVSDLREAGALIAPVCICDNLEMAFNRDVLNSMQGRRVVTYVKKMGMLEICKKYCII